MYDEFADLEFSKDPYKYVSYCSRTDMAMLKNSLTYFRLCMLLRRYEEFEWYDVDYWNKLFEYFCEEGEFKEKFTTIRDVINATTLGRE